MKKEIKLVPYTDNDYDFIYEVKKNAYKKYVENCFGLWDENEQKKYYKNFIDDAKDNTYIIMIGNEKIGFYNGNTLPDGTYAGGNICIIEEYQGKGIGTKILKKILKENEQYDIKAQYFKENPVGNLYKKLVFIITGETEFHYQVIKQKTK